LQEVISLAFSMNPGGGEKASSAKVKKDVASLGYAVQ
jgi:hypothetical protein